MRKKAPKSYFLLFAAVLMLMSISTKNSERVRGVTASILGAGWRSLNDFKLAVGGFFDRFAQSQHGSDRSLKEEVQKLQLKNQLLEAELRKLQGLLGEDLAAFFELDFDFAPARVIFRPPSSWNSSLWIDAGSEENLKRGKDIIVKNSPVVVGKSVIGVIDYVGTRQSRVRLITDSGLRPSVRAKRVVSRRAILLAKGELYGSSQPLWRSEEQVLQGIGFNYDFEDAEGPARDLRTGKPVDPLAKVPALPIIKVDDQLVTTGLDGVFPEGLDVAVVTKISPLKEGDYYYEIEARPTAGNLQELSFVFVIPPVGFESEDQPSLSW